METRAAASARNRESIFYGAGIAVRKRDAEMQSVGTPLARPKMRSAPGRGNVAPAALIDLQARPAALLCSAARYCLFPGKILRDIFICLRL